MSRDAAAGSLLRYVATFFRCFLLPRNATARSCLLNPEWNLGVRWEPLDIVSERERSGLLLVGSVLPAPLARGLPYPSVAARSTNRFESSHFSSSRMAAAVESEAAPVVTASVQPQDDFLKDAVPVVPDRFYFARLKNAPPAPGDFTFFSTDCELIYDSFFDDFGPLNIAKVYRYCEKVHKKLHPEGHGRPRKVLHFSSPTDERKFLNAAWLMSAYCIIKCGRTPQEMMETVEKAARQPLIAFRDASLGPSTYRLNLNDCLVALHRALELKFFDYDSFDLKEYEHYERVENGDFNWITPKMLAFCGPHQKTRTEGYPVHAPEAYFTYFKNHDVSTIVRLNSPQYSSERFTAAGFDHKDLIFPDGTSPGEDILQEFIRIVESAKGAVAVHCKAGLGRTGTLIAAVLMKHHRFSASEAIAWVRIVRPGSVIGQQQHYLESIKDMLWADGENGVPNHHPRASSPEIMNGLPDGIVHHRPVEVVEVTSTSSSVEYKDQSGTSTVHEVVVVEKKVTTVDMDGQCSAANVDDEAVEATQGDVLNMRKAERDLGKSEHDGRKTRSMRGMKSEHPGDRAGTGRPRGKKLKKLKTQ